LRPAALIHLYRVRLRSRLGAELLALAGIAVGVALVFAALVANASVTGAVRELSEGIAGRADFQLAARSAAGFGQRLLGQVDAIPGVAASPVVEAHVNLVGPGGRRSVLLVGGLSGPKGRPGLYLPGPVVEGLGVRRGEELRVETGGRTVRSRLVAELDGGRFGSLAQSPVALAPIPLVRKIAGLRGRISRVFVAAPPDREGAVEAQLGRIAGTRLNLDPADEEVVRFERAAYPTSRSTSLFSALSALVGFLFALNAMLLTLPQRRRLIAELRLAGYAPATVVQIVLGDALVLGIAGAALGLLLGEVASRLLFDSVPGFLTSAFAIGSQRIVSWQSAAVAATAGVLAACSAVLIPIRGLLSTRQKNELPVSATPQRQRLLLPGAALCLGASLAIGIFAPALSLLGIATLLLALLLFLRVWLRFTARLFDAVCRRFRSPAAILAALELRAGSARNRTLALAATGAVAVFAAAAIGGARADLQRGLDRVAADLDRGADVWVAFSGPANIFGTSTIEVPARKIRAIEELPGVSAISRNRGSFLDVGHDRVWVLAPARSRLAPVLRHQVVDGSAPPAGRRVGRGGWVTLSAGLASDLGVGVGDRVQLPLPIPVPVRVAAVTDNLGWPGGAIVLTAPLYARAWGSEAISTLGARVEAGARPFAVASAVRSILGRGNGLRTETASERAGRQRATSRAGLSRLGQIAAMILISSALAMAASMAALVWQRRPTFASLKIHGLGEGELWRALLLEGALLLGSACLLGALFGLLGQALLDRALVAITGFPLVYETAGWATFGITALVTGAALVVLALPGWLAVRGRAQLGLAE
jgi:putative ABC transport system permease protein